MEEKTVSALELSVTYVHNQDSEEMQRTWKWLDDMVGKGNRNKIPSVIAISDSGIGTLLVYDGNTRVAHAREKGYDVRVRIIANQSDFDEYLRDESPSWFGIRDFQELLEYMEIYRLYPWQDGGMPAELREKVSRKYLEMRHREEDEIFGKDDD